MPEIAHSSAANGLNVGITGINGLLGWHLRCYLKMFSSVTAHGADRKTFQDTAALTSFVDSCDTIVHFAGMNRGDENLIEEANVSLMTLLLDCCDKRGRRPHIVFASSTHIDRDTAYARSKRKAAEVLMKWSAKTGAKAAILVLPNVFGEAGRPFYNSVVSTFAYQIAKGETPKIEVDREMELMHAQDVAALVYETLIEGKGGEFRPSGSLLTVSGLLNRLRTFSDEYRNDRIPDVSDHLGHSLFNTLRYYMFPDYYPKQLGLRSDSRGDLYEAVKSAGGGQTFLSTTKPSVMRGNHFHYKKIERFLVVSGQAVIRIRKLFNEHVESFHVAGRQPAYVDMPTLHTHSITNTGDSDLITLFWSDSIFDPANPDTVREQV